MSEGSKKADFYRRLINQQRKNINGEIGKKKILKNYII